MRTIKITNLRLFAALLGPCVLSMIGVLSMNAPSVGEDDWAHQQAQAQREREEWQRQQEQAQRDREQAERDQKERDDWYRQQAQTQKERDDWYAQQAQAQRDREQADRDQKERDDWYKQQQQAQRDYQQSILNRTYDDHPWARAGWTAGAEWTPTGWKLPESVVPPSRVRPASEQIRFESDAIPPQPLMTMNPFVFQPMAGQNQERLRQPFMQTSQQMTREPQVIYPEVIQNPFVGSSQQPEQRMSGRQDFNDQIIQNPFVGRST